MTKLPSKTIYTPSNKAEEAAFPTGMQILNIISFYVCFSLWDFFKLDQLTQRHKSTQTKKYQKKKYNEEGYYSTYCKATKSKKWDPDAKKKN